MPNWFMWRDFRRAFTNDSSLEGLFDASPRSAWPTVFDMMTHLYFATLFVNLRSIVLAINNDVK